MKFVSILLLAFACACSPTKPAPPDPPPLPATYHSDTPTAERQQLPDPWWTVFADHTLNRFEELLLSQNLEFRQGLARLRQLEAQAQLAAASRWPGLGLNSSVERIRTSSDSQSTNRTVSLAATYEVDLWNRLKRGEKAAQLRFAAGQADISTLLMSLSAEIAESYFTAVEQRAQISALERQRDGYHQLVSIISRRYRSGLATAAEVYHARQNLAAIEALIPQYRAALTQAENAVALLLGSPPGSISIDQEVLPEPQPLAATGLPADLLTRRPDIRAALYQLSATDHELAAAMTERLPAINLSATLGRSLNDLSNGRIEGSLWNLVLGLTQPLLDGGRRKSEVKRQTALRDEKLAAYQQTILAALKDVDTALSVERYTFERTLHLEQQRQALLGRLHLARHNYLAGLSDSRDLLDHEISYLNLLTQQFSSRRQWLSSRISLARALGGHWMETELQSRQPSTRQRNHDG